MLSNFRGTVHLEEIKNYKCIYPIVGDRIDFHGYYVTVNNVQFLKEIGDHNVNVKADGIFLLIDLTILNYMDHPITISNDILNVKDEEYNKYEIAQTVLPYLYLINRKSFFIEEISPKVPKKFLFFMRYQLNHYII